MASLALRNGVSRSENTAPASQERACEMVTGQRRKAETMTCASRILATIDAG